MLCADLVQIEWKDRAGNVRQGTAILEDISHSGACLQTDEPLPVETLVQLRHGRKILQGSVSYCIYREIGYFAGITFTASQKWSESVFRPKHLIDPGKLECTERVEPGQ